MRAAAGIDGSLLPPAGQRQLRPDRVLPSDLCSVKSVFHLKSLHHSVYFKHVLKPQE